MKLTKSKLRQIIKEEMESIKEWDTDPEEADALVHDGLSSTVEGWAKEVVDRGDIDELQELYDFLDEMLGKSAGEDPYGLPSSARDRIKNRSKS